jgi:hypothetical protein
MARITLATPSRRMAFLASPLAQIAFFFVLFFNALVFAQGAQIAQGIVNSDQTYVVNDQGESIQEYGVGQPVYIVVNEKDKKNKKSKDFFRVTFDPTNEQGDGWVLKEKVKLMTAYRSIDGKEPKEYDNKGVANVPTKKGTVASSAGVASSGASELSFLEELVKRDEQKQDFKPVTETPDPVPAVAAKGKKGQKNALENDLEFLFQQEGEFKETFNETKTTLKKDMQKKVGISKFTSGSDSFANQVMDQIAAKLQTQGKQDNVPKLAFAQNIEDATSVKTMAIAPDLSGVFFGQMSPKIGDGRLLKIKYYDQELKQFTFEKVAKIPLQEHKKVVDALANECYQFLSK